MAHTVSVYAYTVAISIVESLFVYVFQFPLNIFLRKP